MACVLVTGGAGFIGSCFASMWLAEPSAAVVVLDKLTYAGSRENLAALQGNSRFQFVEGDIGDRSTLTKVLEEFHPSAIFNFAAESHVDRSIDSPEEFLQTNVVGTVRLLAAALSYWRKLPDEEGKHFRFLHVSTDEVYGSLGITGAFTEDHPYHPNSPYAASKASSDHFVRAYHQTYGLPAIITNCSNNYGPRQLPEKLIPLMVLNALEGKRLPVYGDGLNVRDWLYVEDHCQALRLVHAQGRVGEVYNIGGRCECTNLELVGTICDIVDRLCPGLPHAPCRNLIEFVEDRPGHDRRYAIDSSKLQDELGWQPRCDFQAGLERTVQWYLDNPTWVEHRMNDASSRQRLGLGGGTNG
ncbi:MAG: dTDP-glucose 4,6-dehydratase [Planctomycetales bacterium]|nr:dTDP-glucose 4,6-dehydratase [Planctomycetales bacterium]